MIAFVHVAPSGFVNWGFQPIFLFLVIDIVASAKSGKHNVKKPKGGIVFCFLSFMNEKSQKVDCPQPIL